MAVTASRRFLSGIVPANYQIPDGEFLYIDVGSVDNATAEISENLNRVSHSEASSRARKIVHKGTLIYSTIRPYLKNIAIIRNDYDIDLIASTAFAVMHPFSGIDGGFLRYVLLSDYLDKSVNALAKGVAYPAITESDFFSQLIPIPPRAEQRRIVARIDELMARCDALEALRAEREQKRLDAHTAALNVLLGAQEPAAFAEAWQFMTQHFSDLHSVPKNVTELRKAVLQLAVMGKLVEQDPNDPPASELLKEIQEEKNRLIVAGKIRASKPLPPVTPEEVPYQVPAGWEWVRVGDLGNTQTGTTPASKNQDSYGDYMPFIGPSDIKNYSIDYSRQGLSKAGSLTARCVDAGSIMMVCIGGSIGKHAVNDREVSFNQQINTVTPYQPVEADFIFYAMSSLSFQNTVVNMAGGSATPIINKQKWSNIPVALPPLAEQRRIVAKIDQLTALGNALETKIDAQSNTQSALLASVMAAVTPANASPTRRAAPARAPAEEPVRRGPGRPRKEVTEAFSEDGEVPVVRRKPGRPRKEPAEAISAEAMSVTARRGPGRPRKNPAEPTRSIPESTSTIDAIRRLEALKIERAKGTRQVGLFESEADGS